MQPGTVIKTMQCVCRLVRNYIGMFENDMVTIRVLHTGHYVKGTLTAFEKAANRVQGCSTECLVLTGKPLSAGWAASENDDKGPI